MVMQHALHTGNRRRQENSCWTGTAASGSDHFVTLVSPLAPSGAIQDPPSVESIVLMGMPGIERGLRSGARQIPARAAPVDLERVAGSISEALAGFCTSPAIFTVLAMCLMLGIAMYRLLIG
jgi:hypothetical protein